MGFDPDHQNGINRSTRQLKKRQRLRRWWRTGHRAQRLKVNDDRAMPIRSPLKSIWIHNWNSLLTLIRFSSSSSFRWSPPNKKILNNWISTSLISHLITASSQISPRVAFYALWSVFNRVFCFCFDCSTGVFDRMFSFLIDCLDGQSGPNITTARSSFHQ